MTLIEPRLTRIVIAFDTRYILRRSIAIVLPVKVV